MLYRLRALIRKAIYAAMSKGLSPCKATDKKEEKP